MSKQEVITFKVDSKLAELIKDIPNSSNFIREAIKKALQHSCPICNGKGYLDHNELVHLESFMEKHKLEKCGKCNAKVFSCGEPQCD